MSTIAGKIKHRHQTTLVNRIASDISKNVWNDSETVTPSTGSVANGAAMVRDSAKADGWGFGAVVLAINGPTFGGSRSISLSLSAAAQNAVDWLDIELDGDAGYTVTVVVEVRTENASTTVTPKVRNVTTAADSVVGTACSATNADYSGTAQKQTLTLVLAAGLNTYRLMFTASDAINAVYGISNPIKVAA